MHLALLALGCEFTITSINREGKSSLFKIEYWEIAEEFDNEPIPLDEGIPSGSKSVFKPAEFYNPRDEL